MATPDPDLSRDPAGDGQLGRYTAWDVARDLGFNVVLVLIGELVVQIAGWPRFWVLVTALAVGWTARAAVQYWLRRRAADSPGVR